MSSVRANKQTGRDMFHIVAEHPDSGMNYEIQTTTHGPKVALNLAMRLAEKAPERGEWEVWRRTLLGPETLMYRVERDEHGVVRGYTIEEVD